MFRREHLLTLSIVLAFGLCLAALTTSPGAQAQDKKQAQAKKEEKKPTLRDAVVRESPGTIRVKSGFELVQTGESEVTVRRASTKDVLGKVNCGVCTGGTCKAKIIQIRAICRGCGSLTGKDCDFGLF
jgi:hypothetical protein